MVPNRLAPAVPQGTHPPRSWCVRPLSDEEQPAVRHVFDSLSARTRLLRFHAPVPRYPTAWWAALGRACPGHADVALAWVGPEPIGHVMWSRVGATEADLAVVVADAWQGLGVGRALVAHAARTARRAGIARFGAAIHPENASAQQFARQLGGVPRHGGREWRLDLTASAIGDDIPGRGARGAVA